MAHPSLPRWRRVAAVSCLSVSMVTAGMAADGYPGMQALTGQWDLSGPTAVDPPPGERRDTHLRVFLTGEAARAVFDHLPGAPRPDPCGDEGGMLKTAGGMQCTRLPGPKGYECRFSIDLERQVLGGGWAC